MGNMRGATLVERLSSVFEEAYQVRGGKVGTVAVLKGIKG